MDVTSVRPFVTMIGQTEAPQMEGGGVAETDYPNRRTAEWSCHTRGCPTPDQKDIIRARSSLSKFKEKIIEYIDPALYIKQLHEKNFISNEDVLNVRKKSTTKEKAKLFFDLIYEAIGSFRSFLELLEINNDSIFKEISDFYEVSLNYNFFIQI